MKLVVVGCALLGSSSTVAAAQVIARVSLDSNGAQVTHACERAALSHDARFVAFESFSGQLVAGDTNGTRDIFVRDRLLGSTERASVSATEAQANGASTHASISADGSLVAFESRAANLVDGDFYAYADIFVRDRASGWTTRVSVNGAGEQGDQDSYAPSISADGRYVAFTSAASNLVASDTNGWADVFVHDRTSGTNVLASVSSSGVQQLGWSHYPTISGDGRWVAFESLADNLVAGDTNGTLDVFLHDLQTGQTLRVVADALSAEPVALAHDGATLAFVSNSSALVAGDTNGGSDAFVHDVASGVTTRVSIDSAGNQADSTSFRVALSGDGRLVAFDSLSTNLAPGDTPSAADVFVHDRASGVTWLANAATLGTAGSARNSLFASISGDGLHVAFESDASWLVADDTNLAKDVFVRDAPDPTFPSYCTAGVSSSGCAAAISATGTPSASAASGFTLGVFNLEGAKPGLIFYGVSGPSASPWGAGTSFLCVKAPTQRTSVATSGGNAGVCDGVLWIDWNAFIATHPSALGAPFSAGDAVHAQAWYRDPPSSKSTALSNAVEFTLVP